MSSQDFRTPDQEPEKPSETPPATSVSVPASQDSTEPSKDERNWALFAHASGFTTFLSIPGFIGPLIIWLIKKDELPFAAEEAKEALNFQISLMIYALVCVLLTMTFIGAVVGIPGLIAVGLLQIICQIIGIIRSGEGKPYRYPMTMRLVN